MQGGRRVQRWPRFQRHGVRGVRGRLCAGRNGVHALRRRRVQGLPGAGTEPRWRSLPRRLVSGGLEALFSAPAAGTGLAGPGRAVAGHEAQAPGDQLRIGRRQVRRALHQDLYQFLPDHEHLPRHLQHGLASGGGGGVGAGARAVAQPAQLPRPQLPRRQHLLPRPPPDHHPRPPHRLRPPRPPQPRPHPPRRALDLLVPLQALRRQLLARLPLLAVPDLPAGLDHFGARVQVPGDRGQDAAGGAAV
mmetsp:Transcript_57936/g.136306  ORF Transcript_57936/g.136306 Transcript_57936/m.136306 type:complete len:247 (-) Transcript_57936:2052-2792(-)